MLKQTRIVKVVSKARFWASSFLLGMLILEFQGTRRAVAEELAETRDSLSGEVFGLEQLNSSGIRPYGLLLGGFVANLEGGNRTGSVGEGLLDFGVDIDFEEMGGWSGASLHLGAFAIFGDDPSEHLVGDFNAVSNIAAFNTVRLFQAWLQKEWRDGAIAMRIGQIAADDDFMVSENAGLFLNSAFWPIAYRIRQYRRPHFPTGLSRSLGLSQDH